MRAKYSKHFMPADAIDIGSGAGFRAEYFVFTCREKSLPFLRQFAGKPRNRSLGAPLAHIEGSTYLRPRKAFAPQRRHPSNVNLSAWPSEFLALARALRNPALTRSWISDRSNSAIAPII